MPSAACQTCKTRRIKCDESRPSCSRCAKSRRVCIYPEQNKSLAIHNENEFASGATKRPRGPRSSFLRINPDLETKAIAYYLQFHLSINIPGRPSLVGGWSECISQYKAGASSPMVDLALSAMALAVHGRLQHDQEALTAASRKYTALLPKCHDWISQQGRPSPNEIDSGLLTIFLMARYENTVHQPGWYPTRSSIQSLRSWSHHDGAIAMLRLWYDNHKHTAASLVVRQTRRGASKSCLLRDLLLPDFLSDGEVFGEIGADLEYDRVFVKSINLHYESTRLREAKEVTVSDIERLDREGVELDFMLKAWMEGLGPTYSFTEHTVSDPGPWPRKHIYSPQVNVFDNLHTASTWCKYFATRMLIGVTVWRALVKLRPEAEQEVHRSRVNRPLNVVADNLAASIPFCLERVELCSKQKQGKEVRTVKLSMNNIIKPYLVGLVAMPLSIACRIDCMDAKQQQWFRSELGELGRITGDGGLECAESEHWVKL